MMHWNAPSQAMFPGLHVCHSPDLEIAHMEEDLEDLAQVSFI